MFNKIAFIGAGSMSEAFISGIINKEFLKKDQIFVTNHNNLERLNYLKEKYQVQVGHDKQVILKDADLVVLSMKPYDIKSAIESIKPYLSPNQLIISIVAGVSTEYISSLIGMNNPVIRAMPNTSASVGLSATALTKGENTTDHYLIMAKQLFKTIGMTVSVDEKHMDAVTAVSGSGPAYIYYVVEAMEKVAIDLGLDADVAKSLIVQTILGAGQMLKTSGKTAENLRKNITSPAGTTEAAIKTLVTYDFQEALIECVKSACQRSEELGRKL